MQIPELRKEAFSIVRMKFGSHLYGTNTEKSDLDIKGIGMPTVKSILLGKIPKDLINTSTGRKSAKNTADDIDIEILSLHQFIKLALEGQTMAMDMLHCPEDMLLEKPHVIWSKLIENRDKFYSKNIHSFIGYAVKQAAKYGIKGSRLSAAREMVKYLSSLNPGIKLKDTDLDKLPKNEYTKIISPGAPGNERKHPDQQMVPIIECCGKKFHATVTAEYAKIGFSKFEQEYGKRAKMAATNEGIDWKAVSHAFRAAYQMRELLTEGTITFPLPGAEYIKKIKYGELNYNDISPILEDLIEEVKQLKDKSSLPEKPDYNFWEGWLCEIVKTYILSFKYVKKYT